MVLVAQLIQELYLPGPPQKIDEIQKILQRLQKSQKGWEFAGSLLQSHYQTARFFGALTYIVKINTDWYATAS